MLLRHKAPGIESGPANTAKGLEHLEDNWIAVLRWLQANRVDFVLIGAVAQAIRGDVHAKGPVTIVPAPYGRNLERLSRGLWSAHARLRVDGAGAGEGGGPETIPVKMNAEKLARATRWTFRCGECDFDVDGRIPGFPRYQELLYEAGKFSLASDLSVEVASPEDLEHYRHVRRTGLAPEILISRGSTVGREAI